MEERLFCSNKREALPGAQANGPNNTLLFSCERGAKSKEPDPTAVTEFFQLGKSEQSLF